MFDISLHDDLPAELPSDPAPPTTSRGVSYCDGREDERDSIVAFLHERGEADLAFEVEKLRHLEAR